MLIISRYCLLALLLSSLSAGYLPANENKANPHKIKLIGYLDNLTKLPPMEKRIEEKRRACKDLREYEECLRCLLKERDILVGDFYGINLRNYRYVNIFFPLGYISSRIAQVDKEIGKLKSEIDALRREEAKKLTKSANLTTLF